MGVVVPTGRNASAMNGIAAVSPAAIVVVIEEGTGSAVPSTITLTIASIGPPVSFRTVTTPETRTTPVDRGVIGTSADGVELFSMAPPVVDPSMDEFRSNVVTPEANAGTLATDRD